MINHDLLVITLIIRNRNALPVLSFSLVQKNLRSVLKQLDDYFGIGLVILNRGRMTRTTPEPAHRLRASASEMVVESGFESLTLRPRCRDLTRAIGTIHSLLISLKSCRSCFRCNCVIFETVNVFMFSCKLAVGRLVCCDRESGDS
ncbi:hypothetical protein AVEN_270565-1 [Araneus ventricosus]|uniref:Uncharacterized protein n=1 Tax=Araneus ventricosus TaxID=182803 RepID=A0A4Y2B4Q3_ARAVE|nr:hypothetical protein AVEN_270565-1 [Araneus ventricosus]